MSSDEIIDEERANREAHAAKFNYDLRAIYEDLKKSEAEHLKAGLTFIEPPITHLPVNKSLHPGTTALRRFRSANTVATGGLGRYELQTRKHEGIQSAES